MRLHRFYVEQPLGEVVVIKKVDLINQWTKVFRYSKGSIVILFDGRGYDVTYELQDITKSEITLASISKVKSVIPSKNVFLYLSLIKRDNFELVVQKATELGVSAIIPILSDRSEKKHLRLDRLQSIAIEASEQCGRGDILNIKDICSLDEAISLSKEQVACFNFDTTEKLISYKNAIERKELSSVALFIGPEGGWSDHENDLFKKNSVQSVTLGNLILRAETAAIAACSLATI